jgi:hypothetical protein
MSNGWHRTDSSLIHDVNPFSTSGNKNIEGRKGEVQEKMKWADDRTQPSQLLSDSPLPARPVKPHDWTYSSCHTGQIAGPSVCPLTLSIFIRLFLPRSTSIHFGLEE